MRYIRLILCPFLLIGIGLTGLQAQIMVVFEDDGKKSLYNMGDIKKVVFTSDHIQVNTFQGSFDAFMLSEVSSLNFRLSTSLVRNPRLVQTAGKTTLFPNPATEMIQIHTTSTENSTCTIEIISMEGRMVYRQRVYLNQAGYQINISDLASGIYVCKLFIGSAIETIRFVKQ